MDEGRKLTDLEMAEDLDSMERDVNSWEADFLESILRRLRSNRPLSDPQRSSLNQMYDKYFGEGASSQEEDPDNEIDL